MELDLADRAVVISSAASQMGRACARAFAGEGARLGLLDVDAAAAASTASWLRAERGADCSWAVTDIAEEAEVAAAVESMAARLGGIDVVVVPAVTFGGIVPRGAVGPSLLVRHALEYLSTAEDPAVVVTGGGEHGGTTRDDAMDAMRRLVATLSVEARSRGVRINALCTVTVDDRRSRAEQGGHRIPAAARIPPGVERLADVVLWLSSPRSEAINGASLRGDDGSARWSFPA